MGGDIHRETLAGLTESISECSSAFCPLTNPPESLVSMSHSASDTRSPSLADSTHTEPQNPNNTFQGDPSGPALNKLHPTATSRSIYASNGVDLALAIEPDNEHNTPFIRSRLNTDGVYQTWLYSASSPFVWRKSVVEVPFNLRRGSAIRDGKPRDGSSVGDSPVILTEEDGEIFDARSFLLRRFSEDPYLEAKARLLCQEKGTDLETLINHGPPRKLLLNTPELGYTAYGDLQTYPILKALFAQQSFVILQGKKGCGVVNGTFERDFFDRFLEIEAISLSTIATRDGLLVAAPVRLVLSIMVLVLASAVTAAVIIFDDRTNVIEQIESGTFIFALIVLTVPGVISLLSDEPNLLRNVVRGKKLLIRQSQVTEHFNLTRRDYAMLVARTRGSKLVSTDVGCFLTGDERGTHMGDVPVVQCEDLAPFGVICGQSVHYRANWQNVCISNRLGPNRTHLTLEKPKVNYWCAYVRPDTWVGFQRVSYTSGKRSFGPV